MKTEKLLTLDYYVDKITLAMQTDTRLLTQINDAVTILQMYDENINTFKTALQELLYDVIINASIIERITAYKYTDLLEKIAAIFNITRDFVIDFKDPITGNVDITMQTAFNTFNNNKANNTLSTTIHLTDSQMRLLIYCAIMKNSYDGSFEMLYNVYKTEMMFITSDIQVAKEWMIYQTTYAEGTANCVLDYNNYSFGSSPEELSLSQYFTLFYAGLLTIHSAGIYYYQQAIEMASVLFFAETPYSGTDDQFCWSDESDPDHYRLWL